MSKRNKDNSKPVVWGRPTAPIDKKEFERLCAISPTLLECCAVFHVDEVTLNAWCKRTYRATFSHVLPLFAATGKISLRRKIWQLGLEKEQEYALKMLANKHLNMSSSQTSHLSVTETNEAQSKEVKVTWVTGEEDKTYFDT